MFFTIIFFCVIPSTLLSLHSNTPHKYYDDVVAIATSMIGKATVRTSTGEKDLSIGQDLEKGTIIRVTSGKVSIVFFNGDFVEIEKNEELTLGADAKSSTIISAGNQRGVTDAEITSIGQSSVSISNAVLRLSQLTHISSVRGGAKVIAVSPRQVISVLPPTFVWFDTDSSAREKKRSYAFMIFDDRMREVYRATVFGKVYEMNSCSLPKKSRISLMSPGKRFSWGIYEKGKVPAHPQNAEAKFVISDTVGFRESNATMSKFSKALREKKIDINTYHLLVGLYFCDERQRLFSDAIPFLLALSKNNPTQSYPYQRLALILDKFGNDVSIVAGICAARARELAQQ